MSKAVVQENDWCDHLTKIISEGNYGTASGRADLHVSWAAYHSRRREQAVTPVHGPVAVTALLPLFPDDSKSVAMIRHSMNVVKKAVTVVNPRQIPVIACDQPLFKIAKQFQWMWQEEYGEESFVIMLGGRHIKMALLKVLGDLLDGSGWTSALVQAEIATAGTSNSFLKAMHVKKPLVLTRSQLALCTSFGRHHMLSGKHVSRNVTPHRLMNGANREQLKVYSSISSNLCSAPSWTYWPGTDQSMKGTSFCM